MSFDYAAVFTVKEYDYDYRMIFLLMNESEAVNRIKKILIQLKKVGNYDYEKIIYYKDVI